MTGVVIKLDRRFRDQARHAIERYLFDVGVLENTPHRAPARGVPKNLYGGPARRTSGRIEGTMAQVSQMVRGRLHLDLYRRPFKKPKDRDIIAFANSFLKLALQGGQEKRALNLLQAIIRNPILRGDYGRNSSSTTKTKGFNRLLIDTGQLFRAIRARSKVKNVP